MSDPLYDLSPEQRDAAEALARRFAERGIDLTIDEAQLTANLANFVSQVLSEDPKLRTKATRQLESASGTTQAVLALLAKLIVRQYTEDYDGDVNLRALDMLEVFVGTIAALTQSKRPKHAKG